MNAQAAEVDEKISLKMVSEPFAVGTYDAFPSLTLGMSDLDTDLSLRFGTITEEQKIAFSQTMEREGSELSGCWFVGEDNFELCEAEKLIALANLSGSVSHYSDSIHAHFELAMVYLLAEYRGRGAGGKLAAGLGYVIVDTLVETFEEARLSNKPIELTLTADFMSEEGEEFFEMMTCYAGIAEERAEEFGVALSIDVDAGF